MKKTILTLCACMALSFCFISQSLAQLRPGGPASHRYDNRQDDEYRMSHLEGYAGELIGLVLPKRIMDLPIKSGRWDVAESNKARVTDHTNNSANVRLLASGSTVVNYKYRIMRDGKEVSESYPFTIRIYRIDPETLNVPSTLYLGWDVSTTLENKIKLLPEYSETTLSYSIEDPTIADIEPSYSNTNIIGRQLGESYLHIESANGLQADVRVVVQIPLCTSLDLKSADGKTFKVGEQMQLNVKIKPTRAQPILTWQSEKPDIVSVDQDGIVTALAEGKATIRVTSDNGEKDSITLKVK